MTRGARTPALVILALLLACEGSTASWDPGDGGERRLDSGVADPSDDEPTDEPATTRDAATLDALRAEIPTATVASYMRRLAPALAGRTLRAEELTRIEAEGGAAVRDLLREWTREPGFERTARDLISTLLEASGRAGDVDLDLPGNLAAQLARDERPWSEILTADHCVDAAGETIECDTGAPYAAGVLGTRAFLRGNASLFNLKRARTLMRRFVCVDYPIRDTLQPRLERDSLLPLFRATGPDDQADEAAEAGFGNGLACYTCHGQFGAHAQLFVRFDAEGRWRDDATGLQLPGGENGRSEIEGLYTSHLVDPLEAASERSQMLGTDVANLSDAARVMAESEVFLPCASRHLLGYAFSLAESVIRELPVQLIDEVVEDASASGAPSLGDIAVAAFSHAGVIRVAQAP